MANLGDIFIITKDKTVYLTLNSSIGLGSPADGLLLKNPKNVIVNSGTVTGSVPANRKIMLIDERSFRIIAQGISDTNGAVTFYDIPPGIYKLIVDGTSWPGGDGLNYQSVVYDRIVVS